MGLRSKLIFFLVVLPFTCLTLFLGLTVQSFIEDKVAFVFENDDLSSKKLSAELLLLLEKVKNGSEDLVFKAEIDNGDSLEFSFLKEPEKKDKIQTYIVYNFVSVCSEKGNLSQHVSGRDFLIYYCFKHDGGYTIFGIQEDKIKGLFGLRGVSDSVLVRLDGRIVSGPALYKPGKKISDVVGTDIEQAFQSSLIDQTHFEITNQVDQNKFLVNYYRIPDEPLAVLSFTPKTAAQRAALFFTYKGIVSALVLIVIAVIASLVLSSVLIKNLSELTNAIVSFGAGDLEIKIEPKSNDEIGQLTTMFNKMVNQIKVLLRTHEEKVKLDTEMSLAAEFQLKILPPNRLENDLVQFAGHYEPAQKCGGDWWYYVDTEDYFITFIGDVTGHGIKSALLTFAARAVVSEAKKSFISPAETMKTLNNAVYDTLNGSLNMTCFIAAFDKKRSRLIYTNAAHEMPYYFIPNRDIKRTSINVLFRTHGPRLGEVQDYTYIQTEIDFDPRNIFFFYSDGLTDIANPNGETFGERNLLKFFTEMKETSIGVDAALTDLTRTAKNWQNGSVLPDDLSYFFLKMKVK